DILLEESVYSEIKNLYPSTKELIAKCILHEIPIPCLSEALNYFNGYKTQNSSANMIQAQRDYFGAHTYQRTDDPSGKSYHTDWKKTVAND
ncbi:MAG: NADP-dependent phosphogluconate dehydrogenase, partial [Flavobacteriaceae bacterium]|nr:NADP-dependent phosphogluconate dehydrogenase [Flavobacteriaceae bacterium]